MAEGPDKLATTEAVAVSSALAVIGVTLPPTITRSLLQAVSALITSSVDVPVSWLQGKAVENRAESAARAALSTRAVEIAARTIEGDKELAGRATLFLGHRLLREQKAREKIARDAIEDLKANPPQTDAASEIDSDWLDMFTRHAETKTNADVQAYFARVLAGEIRRPSSFSPETLEVLARMSRDVGVLFQRYCGLLTELGSADAVLLTEPVGSIGSNAFEPFGFHFAVVCRLQDAGLVRNDLDAGYNLPAAVLIGARIGGKPVKFETPNPLPSKLVDTRRFKCVLLTAAGTELREIVHVTPNEAYVAKLIEWAGHFDLHHLPE